MTKDTYSIPHRERMLKIAARLVVEFGDDALLLFERCEKELDVARSRNSTMERARKIAANMQARGTQ